MPSSGYSGSTGSDTERALEKLVRDLKRLPGIGTKSATRIAYYILRQSEEYSESLAQNILAARKRLNMCAVCSNFSESPVCFICSNHERSDEILCVVESPADLEAFEKSGKFQGKYHVLHGALSPLDGVDESKLRIQQLQQRLKSGTVKEVVLATNPTVEGDTTALYIARLIKYNGTKVTRIAHGIPVGGEIEYLDGATLGKALQNRVLL
jgi:recombination protein RecR